MTLMCFKVIKNQPENIYQYLADLLEGNKEGKDDADGNEDVEFTTEADLNQGPLNEVADDSHPDGDSNAEVRITHTYFHLSESLLTRVWQCLLQPFTETTQKKLGSPSVEF